jgi:ankyrin repeat protein
MKKANFVDDIRVDNPCSQAWNEMIGNDRVRFCTHCAKDVKDISAMKRKDAMRLVRKMNGKLCVKYRIDPNTKRPIFLDTVQTITRRVPAMAAGAMATSLAFSSAGYAQSDTPQSPPVQIEALQKVEGDVAVISGHVTDPNGAAVAYAAVSLVNEKTYDFRSVSASSEGFYEFRDVPAGEYTIKFEGGGFQARETKGVLVNGGELRRDASLSLPSVSEVVTVGDDDELPRSTSVTVGLVAMSTEMRPVNDFVRAATNDDLDEVKARLIMRAKINSRDKSSNGMTALHAAVENGNIEMVQFLLDNRAKINIRDNDKRTPLMMLDDDATPELLELLLRYGAKPKLLDKEKNSALHHLIENDGDQALISTLITFGVDVNAVNKSGQTVLMLAAENGYEESVKALLESGADVNRLDREGKSAWDVGDTRVRSLLETYGAIAKVNQ